MAQRDQEARDAFARAAALGPGDVPALSDQQLIEYTEALEAAGRHLAALQLAVAKEYDARSHPCSDGEESFAHRLGQRTPAQALATVGLMSAGEARRRVRDALALCRFPVLAEAVACGRVGREAAEAILDPIAKTLHVADPQLAAAAESNLVESATTLPADLVREQAVVWAAVLDPDGREPVEDAAMAKRFFTLGKDVDGLVKVSGLLPTVQAATLRAVFDAHLNPRVRPAFALAEADDAAVGGAGADADAAVAADAGADAAASDRPRDPRTAGQKRADLLHAIFSHYARSDEAPDIAGDHPVVWVSTTEAELAEGAGLGYLAGAAEPVGIALVDQAACTGGVQEVVFDESGAFLRLGRTRRAFSRRQRRAMALRDGPRCVIPGCSTPAYLCEAHHVIAHKDGGRTDLDNGVLLCWFHHHEIDAGPWRLRMVGGRPEVSWVVGRHRSDWSPVNPGVPARRRT
ncbi:HNH endonuclease signature motif containing protein [Gryllotalpicola ginsengisoli]|uniref:HNH endonuclease signature motif containing protein n=1 Tax=Gryllotalpicola ginsengisoli TaxID=444608 RepID=UPI0003B5CEE7|nr:HNH endonuclease signature motif containing protein [Gryllotalpicola ginsengisoli]